MERLEVDELSALLSEMSTSILRMIRRDGADNVLDPSSPNLYRSKFVRYSVKRTILEAWKDRNIDLDAMAVEVIVSLDGDGEVHYHHDACAIITILGPLEGYEEPTGAQFAYGSKTFQPAVSGITLEIRPGKLHGFTVPKGAQPLVFLSVQSRRIEEDFHVV